MPKIKLKVSFYSVAKVLYLLFLVFAFFYVRNALKENTFRAVEAQPKKPPQKVKEVKVKLVLETPSGIKELAAKGNNTDSVEDLLSELRNKSQIYYEIDRYTYGIELINVDDIKIEKDKRWAVFLDQNDITHEIDKVKLVDKAVYIIKQVASQ